jgi:hypothetical protein
MVDSSVVWKDYIPVRTVTKQSDHRGVRAPENAHDAPFGALATGDSPHTLNPNEHLVSVHSVFDRVARDENITVKPGYRRLGHNETITVMMEHHPALDFITIFQRATMHGR